MGSGSIGYDPSFILYQWPRAQSWLVKRMQRKMKATIIFCRPTICVITLQWYESIRELWYSTVDGARCNYVNEVSSMHRPMYIRQKAKIKTPFHIHIRHFINHRLQYLEFICKVVENVPLLYRRRTVAPITTFVDQILQGAYLYLWLNHQKV